MSRRGTICRQVAIPGAVFVLLAGGFAVVWSQNQRHHTELLRGQTRVAAEQTAARLEDALRLRLELVNQIRREWLLAPFASREAFEHRSLALQQQFPGYQAVNWVDPDGVIRWVIPRAANIGAENRDLHEHPEAAETFIRAERTGSIEITPPIRLLQGGVGLASYFPVVRDDVHMGYLNGVFRIRPMVEACLRGTVLSNYSVVVSTAGEDVYRNKVERDSGTAAVAARAGLEIVGHAWTVDLAPAPDRLRLHNPLLSMLLLVAGIGLAGALAWLTRLEMRRQVELARSERKYRELFEESIDVIYVSTPEGRIIDMNPSGLSLFKVDSREELLALDIENELFADPQDRRRLIARLEKEGLVRDHRLRLKDLDGGEISARISASVVRDDDGRVVAIRGIIHDHTETERMQAQISQMQRLESLSGLAGGIAHDFNNILSGILGYASLLRMKLVEPGLVRYAKVIESSVRSASALTSQLLAFSRRGFQRREPVDLNDVVEGTLTIIERTINPAITVERRLEPELPGVVGDSGQLQQVVMNLSLNARDAMPSGGRLIVTTEVAAAPEDGDEPGSEQEDGRCVVLSVQDTGAGMDAETVQRIYEPFFTTKDRDRGTGLGLAVVFGIVKGHDGQIEVESEPGRGSTFTVRLPAGRAPGPEAVPAEVKAGSSPGRVLVVDDNPTIRSMLREVLETNGYSTLGASNGREAVDLYASEGKEIDLVILDLVMPTMDGSEAFKKLRALDRDVVVLLASGYGEEGTGRDLLDGGAKGFIQKPFRPSELLAAVRRALTG